ncbi:MAG: carboxypeptidase-like regulatory domain-containing protein, partial [Bacteroidota bacterium]|nr:carboxypeptidase-like regulatory domain-containing protein [Bacteroidota bacterium]
MQHLLLTFLLLIFTGITTAQNRTVSGVISDPDGPIGGAIITVKGTERYSMTNFDGFYSIMVNDGDVLVFSYVGYESREIVVGYQNKINVSLEPSLTICWFPYKILLPYINSDVLKLGYGVNYSTALIQIDKKLPHDI